MFDRSQPDHHKLEKLKQDQEQYKNAVFNHYLLSVSKPGFFGDHCTLYALACYLKINIIVHELNQPPRSMLDSTRENCLMKCIHLAFDPVRQHYQSCKPLTATGFTSQGMPVKFANVATTPYSAFTSILKPNESSGPTSSQKRNRWETVKKHTGRKTNSSPPTILLTNSFGCLQSKQNDADNDKSEPDREFVNKRSSYIPNQGVKRVRSHGGKSGKPHQRHSEKSDSKGKERQTFGEFCKSFTENNSSTEETSTAQQAATSPEDTQSTTTTQNTPFPATTNTNNTPNAASRKAKPLTQWRTLEIKCVPGAKTVVYGNSIIRHLSQRTQQSTICLPGAKLRNLVKNLQDPEIAHLLKNAENIIIQGASNDAANGSQVDEISADTKNLIFKIRELCPHATITVSGILLRRHDNPTRIQFINSYLSEMLKYLQIPFVDPNVLFRFPVVDGLARDGIHLRFEGASELARIYSSIIRQIESGNLKRHNYSRKIV